MASIAGRLLWAAKTTAQKKIIAWQDNHGWFSYAHWVGQVERPSIAQVLANAPARPAASPTVCFLFNQFYFPSGDAFYQMYAHLQKSIGTLPHDITCEIIVLLPPELANSFEGYDLEHIHPAVSVQSGMPEDWPKVVANIRAEWVVPLTVEDELSLSWGDIFQAYLTANPRADILYWDADELSSVRKRRVGPHLQPDWSPEQIFSGMALEHAAFRRECLLGIPQPPLPEPAGSLAWFFPLVRTAQAIVHIPWILQHCRNIQTADRNERQADYALGLQNDLRAQGYDQAHVTWQEDVLRAAWQAPTPLVSIIIPTKNNLRYLRRCLTSLLEKTDYPHYEILLMDDHSSDPDVLAYYESLRATAANVRIVPMEGPFNYSRVNNQGARLARGDLLLFLNNDVEIIESGWLTEMTRWAQVPGIGMVGAKLLYPNGSIQHAGIVIGLTGHAGHLYAGNPPPQRGLFLSPDAYRSVSAVTGACMLVRREAFEQIGGFDEELSLVFNDVEIGLRSWQHGWRVFYTPAARLIHYEGRSRKHFIPAENIRRGAELLGQRAADGDPFYNENLSYAVNWPTLRRADEPKRAARLRQIVQYHGS